MLNTFINTEVLWFAATRFVPLAIIWIAGFRFIRNNEYSNAHINWAKLRVEAGPNYGDTQLMLVAILAATLFAAFSCEAAKGVFPSDGYKFVMEICLIVLAASAIFLYNEATNTAHRKCILRNQWRLHRIEERRREDEIIVFDRQFNADLEPAWRNVAVMANGWFLPRNLIRFEDLKPDCEIIPFPAKPKN